MTINIDNNIIDSVTIDGQNVSEVTANGNIVWPPQRFFEGFEDGNVNEWQRDTSKSTADIFDATTNNPHTGSYSLQITDNDNPSFEYYRNLPQAYTSIKSFEFYAYAGNHSDDDQLFALQNSNGDNLVRFNFYREISGNSMFVYSDQNTVDTDYFMDENEWHRCRIDNVNMGNSFDWYIYNNGGNNLVRSGTFSTNVTEVSTLEFVSSGTYGGNFTYYIDDIKIEL